MVERQALRHPLQDNKTHRLASQRLGLECRAIHHPAVMVVHVSCKLMQDIDVIALKNFLESTVNKRYPAVVRTILTQLGLPWLLLKYQVVV